MAETITALQILDGLKSAVKQAGEATTRQCFYVRDTGDGSFEAHCIAATVLADLGAPLDTLHRYEDVNVEGIKERNPRWGFKGSGPELPFEIDDAGWEILREAQSVQDDGADWGRALRAAEHTARMEGVIED